MSNVIKMVGEAVEHFEQNKTMRVTVPTASLLLDIMVQHGKIAMWYKNSGNSSTHTEEYDIEYKNSLSYKEIKVMKQGMTVKTLYYYS